MLGSKESKIIFIVGLVFNLAVGAYQVFQLDFVYGDSLARVGQAYRVLFSRDPHLAALGFIWLPLPSILELPLVIFRDLFPPLVSQGFAGNIITALFSSGVLVVLNKIFRHFGVSSLFRYSLLALYQLNPMILLYAASGMTEPIFTFFLLMGLYHLLQWIDNQRAPNLIWMGTAFALASLTRYETVFYALATILIIVIYMLIRRSGWRKIESTLTLAFLPPVFIGAMWLLANWIIMGNPFFFAQSPNIASQLAGIQRGFMGKVAVGLGESLTFTTQLIATVFPLLFLAALLCLFLYWKGYRKALVLGAFALLTPAYLASTTWAGRPLGPWPRYYIYIIPFTILIMGLFFAYLQSFKPKLLSLPIIASSLVLILISGYPVFDAIFYPSKTEGLTGLMATTRRVMGNWQTESPAFGMISAKAVVNYLKSKDLGGKKILLDTFLGFPIVCLADNQKDFIQASDRDFMPLLQQPSEEVGYILIPNPGGGGFSQADAINRVYPDLYKDGAPWATLEKEFIFHGKSCDWRLYRVNHEKLG